MKKFLRLDFGAWKERRLKGSYLRYYIENPEDGRNILARWLDFLGVLLVAWALSFIMLARVTKVQRAFLISATILVIGFVLVDIVKRKQLKGKILQTRRRLAKESYQKKLENMEDDQFCDFVFNLFKKYGIEIKNVPEAGGCGDKLWESIFKENPVGVRFFIAGLPTGDTLKEFLTGLARKDLSAGVVVIREKTSRELRRFIERNRISHEPHRSSRPHLEILDSARAAKMAAYLDYPTSSSLAEVFSELKQHQEKNKKILLRKEMLGSRQKTKGYGLAALLLLLVFVFGPGSAGLGMVYLVFAVLNAALAVASFVVEKQRSRWQLLKP